MTNWQGHKLCILVGSYKNNEKQALKGDALQMRQYSRCKELELIIFGLSFYKA